MLYFIINPNAGNKSAVRIWKAIQSELETRGIAYCFSFTSGIGFASELASEALSQGYSNLISVGGDGTLNEMINGIFKQNLINPTEITIGAIPCGTGNDWKSAHGIPNNPFDALSLILSGRFFYQDIGKAMFVAKKPLVKYFANIAGIGFDAVVANKVNLDKKSGRNGKLVFIRNLLLCLYKSRIDNYTITLDDDTLSCPVFSMAIGIGQRNGGGMMQTPNAVIDDGLFDVTIIKDISKTDVLRYAPKLFNGKFIHHPKVDCYKCKKIRISAESVVDVELEGEHSGYLPIECEIIPKAIKVFSNS